MRKIFLGIALTVVGVGCGAAGEPTGSESTQGAAADKEQPDLIIRHFCNEATCTAAGGYCSVLGCEPGCENPPISCTAYGPPATEAPGSVSISCNGTGNGAYNVFATPDPEIWDGFSWVPPTTGWEQYSSPYQTPYPNAGDFIINGSQLTFGLAEANCFWGTPGGASLNHDFTQCGTVPYPLYPKYVKVCAAPGQATFTKQSGICSGNLEDPSPACIVVAVTPS